MLAPQRQLNISVQKIFNWPETKTNCAFQLIFLPLDSNTPLIEKSIIGVYFAHAMNLHASLKITYTDDEHIVILKILKVNNNNKRDLLGQFQINLESLKAKKVQYFSFGQGYVLQINLYAPTKPLKKTEKTEYILGSQLPSRTQSNFRLHDQDDDQIQKQPVDRKQRYQHLRATHQFDQYGKQIDSNAHATQLREKKSFSEKIGLLLQQVKSIRQSMHIKQNKYSDSNKIKNSNNVNDKKLKKSMSEGRCSVYGVTLKPQSQVKNELTNDKASPKHRLILNTGNVVLCDQYYKSQKQKPKQPIKTKPQIILKIQKPMSTKTTNKNTNYYL